MEFIKKCEKSIRNRKIKSLCKSEKEPESGKPPTSILTGLWSLRIWKYRSIYQIKKSEFVIISIKIGRRNTVY
jgi:mRNA-degrading endonuclease RelE of RelBE toxin-antitoxin system